MLSTALNNLIWWPPTPEKQEYVEIGQPDRAAGVLLHRVWLNHIGIVAHFSAKSLDPPFHDPLAAMLRTISDAARQIGRHAPLVALVVKADSEDNSNSSFTEQLTRLSRDQTWHRGDFILHHVKPEQEVETVAASFLLPFRNIEVSPQSLDLDQAETAYLNELRSRPHHEIDPIVQPLIKAVLAGRKASEQALETLKASLFKTLEDAIEEVSASLPYEVEE